MANAAARIAITAHPGSHDNACSVVVLYLVFRSAPGATHSAGAGSGYPHVAGDPKAGTAAPAFTLTSGAGKPVSLADYRGRTVLLYFQEGLSCQPCWDQIGRASCRERVSYHV